MIEGLIVGLIAGLIAGWIMRGKGYGFLWNILIGLIGGCFGGWLFGALGIAWGGILGTIGTAVVGAVILLWLFQKLCGKK